MLWDSQFCSVFPRTEVRVPPALRLCQELAQQPETSASVGALGVWDDVKHLVDLPNVPHSGGRDSHVAALVLLSSQNTACKAVRSPEPAALWSIPLQL